MPQGSPATEAGTGSLSFGSILKAAVLAGLAAGLVAGAFHFVATEPVIDTAIALEEELHQGEHGGEEIVGRDTQRLGLIVGFLLYGLVWGLLVGFVYRVVQPWLPVNGTLARAAVLAAVGYWALGLFPFLKYPASPPGVGDPDTIAYRQALYLGLLGLSILAVALFSRLGTYLASRGLHRREAWALAGVAAAVVYTVVFVALPDNPDPIPIPMEVVLEFRMLSLVGLTLFWAVLGLAFGLLLRREARQASLVTT